MDYEHSPDTWVILKITNIGSETFYKVLGGWSGGYTQGDSWRMNSGITSIEEDDDYWYFKGYSGSVYRCAKSMNRLSMATAGVYDHLRQNYADKVVLMEDDEWMKEFMQ